MGPGTEIGTPLSEPTLGDPVPAAVSAADLAHLVVDSAAERQLAAESVPEVLLPEDMLPGVGEEQTSLREGLRTSGSRAFIVLAIIVTLDNLQSSGLAVLAPNIQSSFHVSTGAITFVAGIAGGFLVLGIVPMGWLADRFRRAPIIGWATFAFGLMVFASGLAMNIFVFFLARFGAGVSQASTNSVHGSLLADTYPISVRGRLYAAMGMGSGAAMALSPLLVGLIATQVGGPNGWRWAFYILAIPICGGGDLRLPDPGASPWAVREEGRVGRGLQRHPSGRTVARGGVRADHAHPHDQDGPHRLFGDRIRAVHGPGARATSTSSNASAWTPSSGASSAPSAAPAS